MPQMFETNFFYITVVFYILYPFSYPFPSLQYFLAKCQSKIYIMKHDCRKDITIVGITVIVVIVSALLFICCSAHTLFILKWGWPSFSPLSFITMFQLFKSNDS